MILEAFVVLLLGTQSVLAWLKSRSIISPLFITASLWFVLVTLYLVVPHDLNPLRNQFLISIALWTSLFFTAGILIDSSSLNRVNFNLQHASVRYRNILFWTCCGVSPIVCFLLYQKAASQGPEFFFLSLRNISTGVDESGYSVGAFGYVYNLAIIALLLEIVESKLRTFNWRVITLIVINIVFSLLAVSRLSFLNLFVSIIVALLLKDKIKRKHVFVFIAVIVGFLFLLTLLRSLHETPDVSNLVGDTLKIYSFSSMPAFDNINVIDNGYFGQNVFRFFYAVSGSFGSDAPVVKPIYEYTEVPYLTNVYTVMYIFFVDFGFKGVAFGGFCFGLFYQVVYKLSVAGNNAAIIFCALLVPTLIMQFTGEFILTNLSNTIQYLVLIILPYAFGKIK